MKKLIAFTLMLGVAAGLGWLVWFRPVKAEEEEKKPEAVVTVRVAKVARTNLHAYVTGYGVVEPEPTASARLGVSIPGVIAAVHAVEGQSIEAGTLLFEEDSRAAELAVQYAQKTVDRQRKLAETDGTSQKALQEAEQQLAAARAQLALLQIRSPIAGTMTKLNVKPGEAADLTTILAEIVDLQRLVASIALPGDDLHLIKPGQGVELARTDTTNRLATLVTYVSGQIDAKTGSSLVRASLPAGSGWHPGQFITARILWEARNNRLAVPLASVAKDPAGAWHVALVDGEKAVLKPVQPGIREGEWIEVEGDGIEADKLVVTEGAYGLIMAQQFATRIRVINE